VSLGYPLLFAAIFALAAALFLIDPAIDLAVSGWFYQPGPGFFLAPWTPFRLVYLGVPYLIDAIVAGSLIALLTLARRRRVAIFLLVSLILGPGLTVNTLLKDHWGRARPSQIVAFGGDKRFTPPLVPSNECPHNCSFPAGHPSVGFYLVSIAFLVRPGRRRVIGQALAIGLGALTGLVRIAQGGHFLSDVVFSGLITYGTSWLCWQMLIEHDGLRWIKETRFAALSLGALIAVAGSMLFLDEPIARFFHGPGGATLHDVFAFITGFGLSGPYLIISAALFAVGLGLGQFTDHRELGLKIATRALFVFATLALSGLLGDGLKILFGRTRPKLFFADGIHGFTWGAMHADHWSFPSGHAITIVALATALGLIEKRTIPPLIMVAIPVVASRVVLNAHYLSDVIFGAFLGILITLFLWRGFQRYPLNSFSKKT